MELCITRGISNVFLPKAPSHFSPNHVRTVLHCKSRFPAIGKQIRVKYGSHYHAFKCLSSTTEATTYDAAPADKTAPVSITTEEIDPETAAGVSDTSSEQRETASTTPDSISYTKEEVPAPEPEPVLTVKAEEPALEPEPVLTVKAEEPDPVLSEKKEELISQANEVPLESSSVDDSLQLSKLFEDINIKFDGEDKYSYLALGGGALLTLWISAAVVRAIDSIPLLPIVLELVGLGYTLWFSTRYLIFTESRKELVDRVNEFKDEVFGSEND